MAARGIPAFAFVRDFPRLDPDERTFPRHYLLYVSRGAVRLRVGARTWVMPPQRAAWINAATPIVVSSPAPFTTCSVLFSPEHFAAASGDCRVFAMPPLARHLVAYVARWGEDDRETSAARSAAFELLAHVCLESSQQRDAFWLPSPTTPPLRRVLDALLDDPARAFPLTRAARQAAMGSRTFSRALARECGMTWREIVHRARMARATELLARPDVKLSTIAQDVGFSGQPAFVTAFRKFAGEPPSEFRRRVTAADGSFEQHGVRSAKARASHRR